MIGNLQSELLRSQKNNDEFQSSVQKKMSTLETFIQNQMKVGAEDSFANYFNLNEDINYSIIKKDKGE